MRYRNKVTVIKPVYKNFEKFIQGKQHGAEIFDELNPSRLNAYLQTLMTGLTAKVFRTYNASSCMEQQLEKWDMKKNSNASAGELLVFFNQASVQVAILCNHRRTLGAAWGDQMEKLDAKIEEAKEQIEEIREHKNRLEEGKPPLERVAEDGEELPKLPSSVESCEKKIEALEDRIKKIKLKRQDKVGQKEISISTSRVNYIDPRISIAWCNKVGLDISRIFPKTLRDKFGWAIDYVAKKPKFRF